MQKQVKGKAITLTLSPYTYAQLEKLAEQKGLKKSVIATLALEQFAKAEEKAEKGDSNAYSK